MSTEFMSWDWRGQPNLDELDRIVANMTTGGRDRAMLRIHEAQTDMDEYGIVITDEDLTPERVNGLWHAWWRSDR